VYGTVHLGPQRYSESGAMDTTQDGYSVEEFARRHDIGRTTAYEEISSGKLIARKVRGRTIITREDAAAWRGSLPKVMTDTAAA
jgi:hypothetical protein